MLYWSQRYEPKTNFLSMVLDGSENLFYRKRWGKRSRLVLYRCRVAQSGGNWLKLAKTKSLVDKLLCNIDPINVKCLRGSVVEFCSWNLEVMSSIPVKGNFFFFFTFSWGVCGFKPPLNLHDFFLRGIEFSFSFMTFRYHKCYKSDKNRSCQI